MNAERRVGSSTARSFRGRGGAEHVIAVTAPSGLGLADALSAIETRYVEAQDALGLAPESAVFRRLFLSDGVNQADAVRESPLTGDGADGPVAVSIVEQPPLPAAKAALLAYHIAGDSPLAKRRLTPRHLLVSRNGRRHLWSTGLCAGAADLSLSAEAQTRRLFDDLVAALAGEAATLRQHCLRTWIYVRDVDLFYQALVDSRRALFAEQGMGNGRPTIASTGIGGACAHRYDLVMMDAYSALDLEPGQVSQLNDFARMCATTKYNVTFERGTRVAYADRAHLFVSGTASIDAAGQAVHRGDVLRQLERALENVEAVLKAGKATLSDLMYAIVYVRDAADYPRVQGALGKRLPGLPVVVVQAPVCRPEWLIEVEGVAITTNDAPALPAF